MAETAGVQYDISRWEVVPQATTGPRIFIAGTITDTEVPGESDYAEFWVNENIVATLPEDEAGQRAAINPLLQKWVDERHLLWRERLATRPPAPEAVPLDEVARIVGDPGDPNPRLKLTSTHFHRGTRPDGGADSAPDAAGQQRPRRFTLTGKPRDESQQQQTAQPDQQGTGAAQPTAATGSMNPDAGGAGRQQQHQQKQK